MAYVRPATERGRAQFGWLDSHHTFSFGNYYDPNHMGVSVLRVINDDRVDPGAGFGAHGHRDMEILSYVLAGEIEHRDSMGNIKRIPAGDFQIMSAGTGGIHSEYNASDTEPLHFLQIWLLPNARQVSPRYDQRAFDRLPEARPFYTRKPRVPCRCIPMPGYGATRVARTGHSGRTLARSMCMASPVRCMPTASEWGLVTDE